MQLLIFLSPLNRVVWALISSPFLAEFGGLKWTRTIDLTLIRRVL